MSVCHPEAELRGAWCEVSGKIVAGRHKVMFRDQRGSERDQWCVPRPAAQSEQETDRQSGVERRGHRYFGRVQTKVSNDYRDRKKVNYRDHSQSAPAVAGKTLGALTRPRSPNRWPARSRQRRQSVERNTLGALTRPRSPNRWPARSRQRRQSVERNTLGALTRPPSPNRWPAWSRQRRESVEINTLGASRDPPRRTAGPPGRVSAGSRSKHTRGAHATPLAKPLARPVASAPAVGRNTLGADATPLAKPLARPVASAPAVGRNTLGCSRDPPRQTAGPPGRVSAGSRSKHTRALTRPPSPNRWPARSRQRRQSVERNTLGALTRPPSPNRWPARSRQRRQSVERNTLGALTRPRSPNRWRARSRQRRQSLETHSGR